MPTKHTSSAFTATATAQDAVSASGSRKVLIVQPLDGDVYIRTDGTAATVGAGSLLIAEGRTYAPAPDQVPSSAVSIIRAGASNVAVTVVEG